MACVRLRWTASVRDGRPSAAAPGEPGRRDRRRPGAQARLELGPERRRGDVPRHRDDRPLGPVGGSMECHDILASDGPERRLAPFRRASVRVSREHQPSQDARRDRSRGPPPNGAPSPRPPPAAARTRVSWKAGRCRASARRSRPSPRSFRRTESTTSLESRPPSLSRLPPTNSMARSLSCAERVVVPRVRRSAVRLARPSFSGGSRIAPASTEARTTTMGTPGRSATRTTTPFGSAKRLHAAGEDAAGGRRQDLRMRPAWRAPRRQRSGRGPSRQPCAWRHYTGSLDGAGRRTRYRSSSSSTGANASMLSSVFGSSQSCTWLMPSRA